MRGTEMVRSLGSSVLKRVGRATGRFQEETGVPADVLESDDEYLVVFDAPGATASDVQVRYRDDAVVVRIDRFREYREGFEMLFPGRGLALDGRAELPADAVVDPEHARAQLNSDGTLYVFLPRTGDGTEVEVDERGLEEPTAPSTGGESGAGEDAAEE